MSKGHKFEARQFVLELYKYTPKGMIIGRNLLKLLHMYCVCMNYDGLTHVLAYAMMTTDYRKCFEEREKKQLATT